MVIGSTAAPLKSRCLHVPPCASISLHLPPHLYITHLSLFCRIRPPSDRLEMADQVLTGETQRGQRANSSSRARRTRTEPRLLIDDALKEVQATAVAVESSFELSHHQRFAIARCIDLIQPDGEERGSVVERKVSGRSSRVRSILQQIRTHVGRVGFLLCALTFSPTGLRRINEGDALQFPRRLGRWLEGWLQTEPRPHKRLESIAANFKSTLPGS